MLKLLQKIDTELIKNKPDTWLSRVHYMVPVTIVLIAISFIIALTLPLTSNNVALLWTPVAIAIILYLLLLRFQYTYTDQNLSARQLQRIFRRNLVSVSLLVVMATGGCYILSSRVHNVLDRNNFDYDTRLIRIAMIKNELIEYARRGGLNKSTIANREKICSAHQEHVMDSIRIYNYDHYNINYSHVLDSVRRITNKLCDTLQEALANNFVNRSITQLEYFSDEGQVDSAITSYPVEPADSSANFAIDTASAVVGLRPNNNNTPIETNHWLMDLTNEEISIAKVTSRDQLEKYDFTIYKDRDSSNEKINAYFSTLNGQAINIYKSNKFFIELPLALAMALLGAFALTQLSLFVLVKRYLAGGITAFGLYTGLWVGFGFKPEVFINSIWFWILVIGSTLFFLGLVFARRFLFGFKLPVLFIIQVFSNFFIGGLVALLLYLFTLIYDGLPHDADDNPRLWVTLVLIFASYIFFFLLVNYQFIKKYFYDIKTPKK